MPKARTTLKDGRQFWITAAGQRLIQSLAGQSSIPRKIGHPFGSGDVPQGGAYQAAIAGIFVQAGIKVCRHLRIGSEVVHHNPLLQFTDFHRSLPYPLLSRQIQSGFNVPGLRTFVSAGVDGIGSKSVHQPAQKAHGE